MEQYDNYLDGITKVEKLFAGDSSSSRQSPAKKTDKELAAIAKSLGIKPPKV